MARWVCLVGLLLGGCQSLSTPALPSPLRGESRGEAAQRFWQLGQDAMAKGQPHTAIALFEQSLKRDEKLASNHLSLVAAHLTEGNEDAAAVHLAQFLQTNPDHENARFYHAELLLRRGEPAQAKQHFEHFVAQMQDNPNEDLTQMLHCHGRLCEIADSEADAYTVHLHRGIVLFLLARSVASLPGADQEMFSCEGLLCKSAGQLTQARNMRPNEARPSWYLYGVWRRLAQAHQAQRCLRDAQEAAPFSYLTPAEHRSLELAGQGTLSRFKR